MKNKKQITLITLILIILIFTNFFILFSCSSRKLNEQNKLTLSYIDNIYKKDDFKNFSFSVEYNKNAKTFYSISTNKIKDSDLRTKIKRDFSNQVKLSTQNYDLSKKLVNNFEEIVAYNLIKIEIRENNEVLIKYFLFNNNILEEYEGLTTNIEENNERINTIKKLVNNFDTEKIINHLKTCKYLIHKTTNDITYENEIISSYNSTLIDFYKTFISRTNDLKSAALNNYKEVDGLKEINSQYKDNKNIVSLIFYNRDIALVKYYFEKENNILHAEIKSKINENKNITTYYLKIKFN